MKYQKSLRLIDHSIIKKVICSNCEIFKFGDFPTSRFSNLEIFKFRDFHENLQKRMRFSPNLEILTIIPYYFFLLQYSGDPLQLGSWSEG